LIETLNFVIALWGDFEMPEESLTIIESAINDLMVAFDVTEPPVPVEIMLQRPRPGMWKEVNLAELSTAFINVKQRYSPRMSVARLLARCAVRCDWGEVRKLPAVASTDEGLRALARAILMPRSMLDRLPAANRSPITISMRFEVPEEDAQQRLQDLGYVRGDAGVIPSAPSSPSAS